MPPDSLLASQLAADLPAEAEQRGTPRQWSVEAQLLAAVVDATADIGWAVRQVNSKQRVPHPKPLPRPGEVTRRPRRLTPDERALAYAVYKPGGEEDGD